MTASSSCQPRDPHQPSSVIPIRLGLPVARTVLPFVNAYLVRSGAGCVVVDTGPPGSALRILNALRRHRIPEESVRAIVLTHGHYDHTGSALELRRLLRHHPPIAMHPADRPLLNGQSPVSLRGSSLIGALALLGGMAGMALWSAFGKLRPWPEAALREVLWLDEVSASGSPVDLSARCGMDALAVLTPGHSPGSITLKLADRELIVGDIVSRGLQLTEPAWPLLVNDGSEVLPSLRRLAQLQPTVVYPGHGGPFAGVEVERLVERLSRSPGAKRT